MAGTDPLVAVWTSLWERARSLDATDIVERPQVREPFQLLVASLYLQRRALDSFLACGEIHKAIRGVGNTAKPRDVLAIPPDALVHCGDLPQVFGQVNLASASLRLPVAVLEAIEANSAIKPSFDAKALLKYQRNAPRTTAPIDFERGTCANYLEEVGDLGCCSRGAPSLAQAVTALLAHRDDYGHGEVGRPFKLPAPPPETATGMDAWILGREACLNNLYRCKLVQAQHILIATALTGLERAPRG